MPSSKPRLQPVPNMEHEREPLSDTDREEEKSLERGAESPESRVEKTAQMLVMRSVETGNAWTRLLNGQRAEIIKVSRPDIIAGVNLKLKTVEQSAIKDAKDVDIADPKAAKIMDEQIQESHVGAQEVNVLTAIFRDYGPDVWMLKKIDMPSSGQDTERGLDPKQMGNRTEFGGDGKDEIVFVIAASRAQEMKSLFKHPPAVSSGALSTQFDPEERWNYLGNEGFIVKYRHPDTNVMTEIRFLYARDNKIKSMEDFLGEGKKDETEEGPMATVHDIKSKTVES